MTDTSTVRNDKALLGPGKDPDDELAKRAHQAVDTALAGLAKSPARARGDVRRLRARRDRDVLGQLHVDATMAHADEQVAQILDDAEVEAYRTIHRSQYQQQTWSCHIPT